MALAEAGYPDAEVDLGAGGGWVSIDNNVPLEVAWKAAALSGATMKCWPCFQRDPYGLFDCDHEVDIIQ